MLGSGYSDLDTPASTKVPGLGFRDQSEFRDLELRSGFAARVSALLRGRSRSFDEKLQVL